MATSPSSAEKPTAKDASTIPNEIPATKKFAEEKSDRYRGTVGEFGRFVRTVIIALLIFLVLFFVDILAGLVVFTVGSVYAIAVLFGVRGAESWGMRARRSAVSAAQTSAQGVQSAYRAVRQEVRKRLED